MTLVKSWKLLLGLLWKQKVCLELMCDDFLVRKQALLDYKKADFTKWPYWIFFKGLTHDFGQKLEITPCFGFG